MTRGKILIGAPELKRLMGGDSVTVNLKPDMDSLELKLSAIAQSQLRQKQADPDWIAMLNHVLATK